MVVKIKEMYFSFSSTHIKTFSFNVKPNEVQLSTDPGVSDRVFTIFSEFVPGGSATRLGIEWNLISTNHEINVTVLSFFSALVIHFGKHVWSSRLQDVKIL